MVDAGKRIAITGFFVAQRRPAMRATVHEGTVGISRTLHDHDRRIADKIGLEVTYGRDFHIDADKIPDRALEQEILFALVKRLVRIDLERNAAHPSFRPLDTLFPYCYITHSRLLKLHWARSVSYDIPIHKLLRRFC